MSHKNSPSKQPAPAQAGKPDRPDKRKDLPESADNPAETEGGVRSPLDGKFEADHRPSR